MKVRNVGNSRVFIGSKVIAPGEEAELNSEEAMMSGVMALLDSGELVKVKAQKRSTKKKVEQEEQKAESVSEEEDK